MGYVDYNFYTTEYYGDIIPESDFGKYSSKASDKLDLLTFGRILLIDGKIKVLNKYGNALDADEKLEVKIKKATCKIADLLFDIDKIESAKRESIGFEKSEFGMKSKVISSVSSGSESISYQSVGSSNQSVVEAVAFDLNAQNKLLYESARDYLTGTGLLYAGF